MSKNVLTKQKELAIKKLLGDTEYTIIHDRMIQNYNGLGYLVLTKKERDSLEEDVFFSILKEQDSDLLEVYLPQDLETAKVLPYIARIKQDPDLDDYTKNRLIQQLISFDIYIADMFETNKDGRTALSSQQIIETNVNGIVIILIPLDTSPEECLLHISKLLGAKGFMRLPEGRLPEGRLPCFLDEDNSSETYPPEDTLIASSLKDLLQMFRSTLSNMLSKDRPNTYVTVRSVLVTEEKDSYQLTYSITSTSGKLTPKTSY